MRHSNIIDYSKKFPNIKTLKKCADILQKPTFFKRFEEFVVYSALHADQVFRTSSLEAIVNDYRGLQNIRKIMGESHYEFHCKNAPGFYRNCEMIPLLLGTKNKEFVQKTAQKIIDLQNSNPEYVKFDADGLPLRKFYPCQKPTKSDLHCKEFPSTYVNPVDTFVNQVNPFSGKMVPWQIAVDDNPLDKALEHLSVDSLFTVEILKIERSWLEKAASGLLGEDDYQPGLTKSVRLINDVSERLVKTAEDISKDGMSIFSKFYAKCVI